jgi:hypothetical protein
MLSGAVLLVMSGIPKLRRPHATIAALRSIGATWVGPTTVRALALGELAVGVSAVVLGGRWADAAVATLYVGFSAFLAVALRTPAASCGCTARDDTPPTVGHLVMTSSFAVAALAAVIAGGRTGLVTIAGHAPSGELVAAAGFALIATWLAWSILTLSIQPPAVRRT